MRKLKPVLPSLREKKRYLAFEIISKEPISSFEEIRQKIWSAVLGLLGELGSARAGMIILKDKYDRTAQRGLIKISNKSVQHLQMALATIDSIEKKQVIFRSIGVSGILKKAEKLAA